MTMAPSNAGALPVNPPALAQRITRHFEKYGHRLDANPLVLVHAAPVWPHEPVLSTRDGRRVRVVPCVSMLAIWEQVAADRDLPHVLLTDLDDVELGTGILSQVLGGRILDMEPWGLVEDCFGVQQLDPRLHAEKWAGPALVDAMPPNGWPRLAGTVLQRDVAMRHLLAERLELARLGLAPEDIDAPSLLRWSTLPFAQEAFDRLPGAERSGLLTWLGNELGQPAAVLSALLSAGRASDAFPLGLVCDAVWSADGPDALRGQGRIEQYLGAAHLDAAAMRSYAQATTRTLAGLLSAANTREAEAVSARQCANRVLDRAEELLLGFAMAELGRFSNTLRSGFEHRLGTVATSLRTALDKPGEGSLAAAAAAVDRLAAHHLAVDYRHRVTRTRMALRLIRWLASAIGAPASVAGAIDEQIAQWGWVDLAADQVWAGENRNTGLARVYRDIAEAVRQRRSDLDRAFASQLAAWTSGGGEPGELLTVEAVLPTVVAPLVRAAERPVLVIVIDGMSAAVAAELAEDMTSNGWLEYDPLAGKPANGSAPRRRGAVAALPTVTSVSRASLLSALLCSGGQDEERAAFEGHRLWRGRAARLFHKNAVYGGAGEELSEDLRQALSDPEILVAAVVNTVDDALDRGRQDADLTWQVNNLGPLRAMLDHARYHGRAVILTSDHGHVLERDGTARSAAAPASARHRTDPAPPGEGEVELSGPRVVADEGRIVALWDPRLRYLPRRSGYHGGASLAEVTVPVLAMLPLGAAAPAGWRPLGPQRPSWWSAPDAAQALAPAPGTTPRHSRRVKASAARPENALFDTPVESSCAGAAPGQERAAQSLVEQVLAAEMFAAQHALTPRKVPLQKVRGALSALIEANGVLPVALVAEGAGEHQARATGFLVTLQQIFNVDNFPVLSLTDDGRTARLDRGLLRQQFGIDRVRP
jgi:PglZ domain